MCGKTLGEGLMLNAEIFRKLPRMVAPSDQGDNEWRPEDQEDLLTMDAIGALSLLPRSVALRRFLERVKRVSDGEPIAKEVLDSIRGRLDELAFKFWPSFEVEGGFSSNSVEPDVQISLPAAKQRDGRSGFMILLEAKWTASALGGDISQLARQYWTLRKLSDGSRGLAKDHSILLCITPGRSAPLVWAPVLSKDGKSIVRSDECVQAHEQIERYLDFAAKFIEPAEERPRCEAWGREAKRFTYWISWLDIAKVIAESVDDLRDRHRRASGEKPEVREMAASVLRLAEAALEVVVKKRKLSGFEGFAFLADPERLRLLEPLLEFNGRFLDLSSSERIR
jgi:hypothetical protein